MLASPAIEGRIAVCKTFPLRRKRTVSVVFGTGETITVKAKGAGVAPIGSKVYLIDSDVKTPELAFKGRRLYLDFSKHKLEGSGYGVWLGGVSRAQDESGDFECLSMMVDDWFTFVEDDVALTLLCVTNGDGHFRVGRDHITRV